VRIHWTNTAIEHLVSIYEYVAHDSKPYAERLVDKLTRRSEQIATFPLSGRIVPEYKNENIREVIERPYRIIYLIKVDQIDILAVVHGAQEL
jgi:addiction module RelE/StbE family toxin